MRADECGRVDEIDRVDEVPHPLSDPVLLAVQSDMMTAIRQTFWGNMPGLKACRAAIALCKKTKQPKHAYAALITSTFPLLSSIFYIFFHTLQR